jgi:tRNA(His) 5'-end guanylyltransferase
MTDLGDRMKAYEAVTRSVLLPHSYTILRVDGRAFHSYLRFAAKPYDIEFMEAMQVVAQDLCTEVSGARFAYGQSDEVSLLLSDVEPQAQPWFGGVVQKMASVAAAVATISFAQVRSCRGRPHFDARVFTLPSATEVANYFIWRQRDAVRNSISMAAQALFTPTQLHGVKTNQMQEMLWTEHGINWDDYRGELKRGWVVTRATREAPVSYTARSGEVVNAVVPRTFWDPAAAPHFTVEDPFWGTLL